MARPTNASKLDRATRDAEDLIRSSVVELTQVLVKSALETRQEIACPHCRRKFVSDKLGDPRIALALLERVAGKATEKKDTGPQGPLMDLLAQLSEAGEDETKRVLSPGDKATIQVALAKAKVSAV